MKHLQYKYCTEAPTYKDNGIDSYLFEKVLNEMNPILFCIEEPLTKVNQELIVIVKIPEYHYKNLALRGIVELDVLSMYQKHLEFNSYARLMYVNVWKVKALKVVIEPISHSGLSALMLNKGLGSIQSKIAGLSITINQFSDCIKRGFGSTLKK